MLTTAIMIIITITEAALSAYLILDYHREVMNRGFYRDDYKSNTFS